MLAHTVVFPLSARILGAYCWEPLGVVCCGLREVPWACSAVTLQWQLAGSGLGVGCGHSGVERGGGWCTDVMRHRAPLPAGRVAAAGWAVQPLVMLSDSGVAERCGCVRECVVAPDRGVLSPAVPHLAAGRTVRSLLSCPMLVPCCLTLPVALEWAMWLCVRMRSSRCVGG